MTEYNVLLLGSTKSGKSALVSRFMDKDVYLKDYHETIVDTYRQLMFMFDNQGVRTRKVSLNIRDVGHRFLRESMLQEQDMFIVCFDITNQDSFFGMSKICKMLMEMQLVENVKRQILVCGLRSDLTEQRMIDY